MERSAVGAAYLAATTDSERTELMHKLKLKSSPDACPAIQQFLDSSRTMYQAHGYVLSLGQLHPEICAVGVPIVAPNGRTIMAINCGGPKSTMTVEALTGPIVEALFNVAAKLRALL
jgi:DNA-binding IclR family transcriptional regulator